MTKDKLLNQDDFYLPYPKIVLLLIGLMFQLVTQVFPTLTPSIMVPLRDSLGQEIIHVIVFLTVFIHALEAIYAFYLALNYGFPFLLGLRESNSKYINKKK
ncbi:hypothetical protein K502DRAFT_362666 [Neoconidiobolus thromboides FSU 785]|nr:hypothetical protein K502DRAFT_362666 [Neoconidiobolus thromboides FSU 785]